MPSLDTVTGLLTHYGYFLLLPAAIVEGPIVTVIAAFLASTGILSVYAVYVIGVLGDLIGDTIYYWIGRTGRRSFIPKYGRFIGLTEERVKMAEGHYTKHLWKTIVIGKITQAPILLVVVSAGIAKVDFKKFIGVIFLVTLPKVLVFTLLGFYLGESYKAIGHGLDVSLVAGWIVVVVGFAGLLIWKRRSPEKSK